MSSIVLLKCVFVFKVALLTTQIFAIKAHVFDPLSLL